MLKVLLDKNNISGSKILCLGAHSDDIEIGCGGTVLTLVENFENLTFYWVVFSSDQQRAQEARESANRFLKHAASKKVTVNDFRDGFFPYIGKDIKEFFEKLKQEISPDIIFTHHRHDFHQDHRLICELTWNTFRDHLILEYEIPKYDGDFGSPNLYVHLSEKICRKKIHHIVDTFRSQTENQWFTDDTFLSLLRLRGVESNSPSKYAEGFYCRKMVFDFDGS